MAKRLRDYLKFMERVCSTKGEQKEVEKIKSDLMIQISFFQHERLIHLLVTILFALLSIGTLFMAVTAPSPAIFILELLFLGLLIPYIKHYYLLENGVQKLYEYYDTFSGVEWQSK